MTKSNDSPYPMKEFIKKQKERKKEIKKVINIELKRCHFCKNKKGITIRHCFISGDFSVGCMSCGAKGPSLYLKEEAALAWNEGVDLPWDDKKETNND